ESGTGKELAASLIHQLSARRDKPFVPINCGAIPSNLIESLLFGHEKGAFTGAVERNLGVFEQADQGTLFLDEIGEMPIELQTRLLRVLENGMVKRIGARDEKKVDVRIITATNRDLQDSVRNGAFREDLFFRLHIFPILLPPLRERRREIPTLARHFLETLSANGAEIEIEPASMEKLSRHDWPGNIRELKNTIQRALLLAETKITTNEIEFSFSTSNGNGNGAVASKKDLADQERESIIATIRKARGNHSQACRYLGIARSTLVSKLRRHQIQPQEWE
ncbi:MAG: sigma-54 dependent transcriptional regulator, partial [Deltaproteobacteria bacterium]|nr:sigma-54 dependent transcriptional regulator [Deltaproteobacteria bacterium]